MTLNESLTSKWVSVIANARQTQLTKYFEDKPNDRIETQEWSKSERSQFYTTRNR